MFEAHRVDDVRRAEAAAMATAPEGALMQRAAAGVATECARLLRDLTGGVSGRRVVLLVGAGNNGGDALWAGARLAGRGADVRAVLISPQVHAEGLAALRAVGGRGIDVRADGGESAAGAALERADLVVDGIVGIGGKPGLRDPVTRLVAAVPAGVPVVAVDLPSGVDPDTGELPGEHVRADVTVTFGTVKPCLLLPPGSAAAGRVRLVDIGLTPHLPDAAVERITPADAADRWPVPRAEDDKYRRGVVGVVAGEPQFSGAAVLVCGGAVRAGAGMVRYHGPDAVATAVRAAWPEVVVADGRVQAWVLGSGVDAGSGGGQPDAIRQALAAGEPCVVDAGALGIFAESVAARDGDPADVADRILLTPHAGELARLLSALPGAGGEVSRGDVEARPAEHAVRAARSTGATVLLKGATTLLARPDGRLRSQHDAVPWLATAGAGDVLAGIAGALLAAGLDPFDAGALAALVHGRAAAAASGGGPIVAADVTQALPGVVAELLGGPPVAATISGQMGAL